MKTESVAVEAVPRKRTRLPLVLALLVLSPVCAEYIQAYDDHTGKPLALLGALLIFVPLYGAPAVVLRELAVRFRVDWPGVLSLATGLGILQAGVIDQSMFNLDDPRIPYWDDMFGPTFVEPLGLAISPTIGFVLGHTIWSFAAPIALTQGLDPRLSRRPWLRWPGLSVLVLLYLAAAGLIASNLSPADRAAPGQLAGALAAVALLALFAFTLGRRPRRSRDRRTLPPLPLAVLAAVAATGFNVLGASVAATAGAAVLLLAAGLGLRHLSGSRDWGVRHVAAVATGAAAGRAAIGFLSDPIGDVSAAEQLGHNVFFLTLILLLGLWTMTRRGHQDRRSDRNPSIGTGRSIASKSADQSAAR